MNQNSERVSNQTVDNRFARRLTDYTRSYGQPLILEAAVRNAVLNVVAEGPRTVAETTLATGASFRGLRAIMDALTAMGFLKKEAGRYAVDQEKSTQLIRGRSGYQGQLLTFFITEALPRWLRLPWDIETGDLEQLVRPEKARGACFHADLEKLFHMLVLEAAIRNGVFDVLDGGGRSAKEVASRVGSSAKGVAWLLDALVEMDFVLRDGDQFALSHGSERMLVSLRPEQFKGENCSGSPRISSPGG